MPRVPVILCVVLAVFLSGTAFAAGCDDGNAGLTAEAASREEPYLNAQNALLFLNEAARALKADYMNPANRAAYQQRQADVQATQLQLVRFAQQRRMLATEVARLRQMLTVEVDVNAGVRTALSGPPAPSADSQKPLEGRESNAGPPISAAAFAPPVELADGTPNGERARVIAVESAAAGRDDRFPDAIKEVPDFGAFVASASSGSNQDFSPDAQQGHAPTDRSPASVGDNDTNLSISRSVGGTGLRRNVAALNVDWYNQGGQGGNYGPVAAKQSSYSLPAVPAKDLALGIFGFLFLGLVLISQRHRLQSATEPATRPQGDGTTALGPSISSEPDPLKTGGLTIEKNPFFPGWVLVMTSGDRGKRIVARIRTGSVVRGTRLAGFPTNQRFRLTETNEWSATQEQERLIFEIDHDLMFHAS